MRLNDLEGAYWMGTEMGQLGAYGFHGEIHLSPSFWYTTAHGTFFLSFSVKCDIFWLFRAHGGNFLSFKQKRQKNATMGPARHNHAMMGPAQHFTTICSHGVLPVSLTP